MNRQSDRDHVLSRALNRRVTLEATARAARAPAKAEEYWPDIEGLEHRDTVTDFALPEGTFFDCATVHLLTTATLDRLRELYPRGRFEVRRFRPNIVVDAAGGGTSFVENAWIGHTIRIGNEVRLNISGPCPRCVMTTLAQGDLPRDPGILRTAEQHTGPTSASMLAWRADERSVAVIRSVSSNRQPTDRTPRRADARRRARSVDP